MIRNYFIIAWRNIIRNKLYSSINIIGLSVGIACCALIFLYVQFESSFDKSNENIDRIYRVNVHIKPENRILASSSPPMAPLLQANFPEIKKAVRINFMNKGTLSYGDKKFYDNRIMAADSTLSDVFTFQTLEGNLRKSLSIPNSIVLTQTAVKKYFGTEDAMGKTMRLSNTIDLTVTGIIKDPPLNSHFNFDCLISREGFALVSRPGYAFYPNMTANQIDSVYNVHYENNIIGAIYEVYSYILVEKNTNPQLLEKKVSAYMEHHLQEHKRYSGMWYNLKLQPLSDIHLKSNLDHEIKPNNDIKYIYIFSATAILILLIACFNFINLSTARSLNRSKEIGLRKVIGAARLQLIGQFLGESFLFSIIGSLISIIFVVLALPFFNEFLGSPLSLNLGVAWVYLIIIFCIGLLSGFYPALLMSSFSPIKALKGVIKHGWQDILFRKGLVVLQFTIAVILIISSSIILKQMNFIRNQNIGMKKEQLLQINLRKSELIFNEFNKNPNVLSSSLNNFSFKSIPKIMMWPENEGQEQQSERNNICVDENFLKTYQIKLINGRNFSKDFPSDETESFIVNESAVKSFGWKNEEAIGKMIYWYKIKPVPEVGKIIGVVKDFNYTSLHNNVSPLIIQIWRPRSNYITLRLKAGDISSTISQLEASWKDLVPDVPFNYSFLDEDFDNLYKAEQKLQTLISIFTFLSVFVACLGLFGLAAFAIKQRVKEIGIRKILGANVSRLVQLLSKDFVKLVLISIIIASPIAWYFTNKWLQDFAYKIEIGYWTFVLAGSLALMVAFLTISFQTVKAASANPIKSLRTE
jgi:putative ABC transport system permease protein